MANRDDRVGWNVIGGFLSITGGAFLYSAYRDAAKRKYVLKTPWTGIAELEKIKYGEAPLYVKIEGVIGTDFPITAELSKEQAAIYEKKSEGIIAGTWRRLWERPTSDAIRLVALQAYGTLGAYASPHWIVSSWRNSVVSPPSISKLRTRRPARKKCASTHRPFLTPSLRWRKYTSTRSPGATSSSP